MIGSSSHCQETRRRSPASCEEHLCPCPGGRAHLTPLCQQHHTEAEQSFPFETPQYKIKRRGFFVWVFWCFLCFFFGQPWGYFFPLDVGKMFLTFRVREIKNVLRKAVSEEVIRFHTRSQNIREVWRRCRWGMLAGGSRRA